MKVVQGSYKVEQRDIPQVTTRRAVGTFESQRTDSRRFQHWISRASVSSSRALVIHAVSGRHNLVQSSLLSLRNC